MRYLLVLMCALSFVTAACGSAAGSITPITALPSDTANTSLNDEPTSTPPTLDVQPTATLSMMEQLQIFARQTQAVGGSIPTPTPWNNNLGEGQARDLAFAADVAFQPTPRARIDFDENPVAITFDEFYDGSNLRAGLILSDKLVSLDGQRVVMEGYMAPPLKPELDFFVLTRIRLSFCPFCTTGADWPDDIALIYLDEASTTTPTLSPVRITGQIEVGTSVDQETGMVSLVRIYVDNMEILG